MPEVPLNSLNNKLYFCFLNLSQSSLTVLNPSFCFYNRDTKFSTVVFFLNILNMLGLSSDLSESSIIGRNVIKGPIH